MIIFYFVVGKGIENVNFTIFGGLWFPCWLKSASSRRPTLEGIPGTPAVSPVTRNRRPSDALGWDALLFGLPNAFII